MPVVRSVPRPLLAVSTIAIAAAPVIALVSGAGAAQIAQAPAVGSCSASGPTLIATEPSASQSAPAVATVVKTAPSVTATAPTVIPVPKEPEDPPDSIRIVGAASMSGLSPIVSGARAGSTSFTWVGAAFVSANGRVWFLPPPNRSGLSAAVGGRYLMAEAKPVAIYYTDIAGGVGYRWALGHHHHISTIAGMQGSGGLGMQTEIKVIRLPELTASYQWQSRTALFEAGPLGGLSLAGRFSVGKTVVGDAKPESQDFFANTHYFRFYAGAQASVLVAPFMASVVVRRTFLGANDQGSALDQGRALLCSKLTKSTGLLTIGGCLFGDAVRGDVVRVAPIPGPGGEGWYFRAGLDLLFMWAQNR
ncbi:MAG: hypothetical protein HY898_32565 [Deltaproteobacteria bacterium]|nr:hypothetical protein [Deltaproteobacteria bacterium]